MTASTNAGNTIHAFDTLVVIFVVWDRARIHRVWYEVTRHY